MAKRSSTNKKKTGRPRRSPVDAIAVRLWFGGLQGSTGRPSGHFHDRLFLGEYFNLKDPQGGVFHNPPERFRRYKMGKSTPELDTQQLVDQEYPGMSSWLHLPLFALMRRPKMSLAKLEELLQSIKSPRVNKRLFGPSPAEGRNTLKRLETVEAVQAITEFEREADATALTALLALITQGFHQETYTQVGLAQAAAGRVLMRESMLWPWSSIKDELFGELNKHFLSRVDRPFMGIPAYDGSPGELEEFRFGVSLRVRLVKQLERIELLRSHPDDHRMSIFTVEQAAKEFTDGRLLLALAKLEQIQGPNDARKEPLAAKIRDYMRSNRPFREDLTGIMPAGWVPPSKANPRAEDQLAP